MTAMNKDSNERIVGARKGHPGRPCRLAAGATCSILLPVLLGQGLAFETAMATEPPLPAEARSEAEIQTQIDSFSRRPRRIFISSSTSREGFQKYFKLWLAHAQRTMDAGEWPATRPDDRYDAILTLSIDASGHLEQVEVIRSSGSNVVDQRLVSVVQAATPFPIPPYGDEYDFLHLTYTIHLLSPEQIAARTLELGDASAGD